MSWTLYLVRHGIAAAASPEGDDRERALTPEGKRKMARAATGLQSIGIVPDVLLSSPLRRAQETGVVVGAALAPDVTIEIYPPLAPGHGPEEVVKGLRAFRQGRHLMLFGHQPDLGELASYLLTGSSGLVPLPFKKGAVAAIEVPSLPPRTTGVLKWFVTPKQLRALARGRRKAAAPG